MATANHPKIVNVENESVFIGSLGTKSQSYRALAHIKKGKRDVHGHTPDEDQIQKVCFVNGEVIKAPCDGHGTTDAN